MNAIDVAEQTGLIAITSASGRTMLHLLVGPEANARTVCGRYRFDRATGDEPVDNNTRLCMVCTGQHTDPFATRKTLGDHIEQRALVVRL